MKKIFIGILFLIAFFALNGEFISTDISNFDFVNKDMAFSVAKEKILSVYNIQNFFNEPICLFGLDDSIYAYMFLFSFDNSILDLDQLFSEIEKRKNLNDEKALSLLDKVGYIIISARYENNVILEYGNGIPYALSKFNSIKRKFNLSDRGKLYYWGHGRFYYENKNTAFDLAEFQTFKKIIYVNSKTVSEKWKSILSKTYKISNTKSTAYIPNVPFVLWSYGCSPTSSSMIFSYYDSRGYGDFVDYYFTRYDNVIGTNRINVPSAQRELSILMNTDSVDSGSTSINSIQPANQSFANVSHPYSFVCGSHLLGQTAENFFYPYIKTEVDSQRPAHWAVLNYYYEGQYIGHSIVSIGYDDGGSDTLIQIHNTWDYTEPFWNLYTNVGDTLSYSCFYEIKPNGGNSYRTGNLSISGRKYFKGLKGIVNFSNISDSLNSIKLYYSIDNFANKNYIGETFDTLFILTPTFSGDANFSAEFLTLGGTILATDGTYSDMTVSSLDDTNNLLLLSYTSDNASSYYSIKRGDTLIVLAGNGIREYLLKDETLPQLIYKKEDGLVYKFLEFVNDTIVIAGTESGIFTAKRNGGYTNIDTFITNGVLADMNYKGGTIFATSALYLYALNLNPDFTISLVDTFLEGVRKQYTSVSINDSFVYLTDLLNGIYIMKTEYPSSGFYSDTLLETSYNESFADIKNDTLYLACLGSGISSYSLSEDGTPSFIANYPIGTVNKIKPIQSGLACFNNTLGVSIRRYSTMSELSHLYIGSKMTDLNEDFAGERYYFSDNSNGLFISSFDPTAGINRDYERKNFSFHISEFSRGKIVVDYHIENTDFGKVSVFDITGRKVYHKDLYFRIADSHFELRENFASGIYFVFIEFGGKTEIAKTNIVK